MKLSFEQKQMHAVLRRSRPAARVLILLALLAPLPGCWKFWQTRQERTYDSQGAANSYYQEAVGNSVAPYDTGIHLEIPTNRPPLTARNPEANEKWPMTLRETLEIALKNSKIVRTIRSRRGAAESNGVTAYDPAIDETRIQQELATFDTQLIFNLFWGKDESELNSNVAPGGGTVGVGAGIPFIFKQDLFGGASGRNTGLPGSGDVLSLRKQLANGDELSFGFNTDYSLTNVPATNRAFRAAYDSRIFTTFTHPLLNGHGVDVNRAQIVIARLEADRSLWEFKRSLQDLIREVEQKYWELVLAQAQYWATNRAIELNREVVQRIRLELEAGTGNEADLTEAEVQFEQLLAERFASLVGGGELAPVRPRFPAGPLLRVERELRSLLGLPPSDGKRIVAVDEPVVAPVQYDYQSQVTEAFTYHPELQQLKLRIAQRRQALLVARNAALPKVDLFVRGEDTGLGGKFDDSVRQLGTLNFGNVTYGLQAQVAIGYRRETALIQQRQLELEREEELLRDKGREVESFVAIVFAEIESQSDAQGPTLLAKKFAEKQLQTQLLLYEEGKLTIDRLLNAVRSYADTTISEIAHRANYQVTLANLELAKGTIFQYNSIHIHEGRWPEAAYCQSINQVLDRQRAIEWYHGPYQSAEPSKSLSVYDRVEGVTPESVSHEVAPEPATGPSESAKGPLEIPVDFSRRRKPANPNGTESDVKAAKFEPEDTPRSAP